MIIKITNPDNLFIIYNFLLSWRTCYASKYVNDARNASTHNASLQSIAISGKPLPACVEKQDKDPSRVFLLASLGLRLDSSATAGWIWGSRPDSSWGGCPECGRAPGCWVHTLTAALTKWEHLRQGQSVRSVAFNSTPWTKTEHRITDMMMIYSDFLFLYFFLLNSFSFSASSQ